ncbi:MAG: peptidase [Rhizobiaceae bacterium]|nr:peptidase [Rhizobiaceae bacterium]
MSPSLTRLLPVLSAVFLSACTVVVDESRPLPPPPPGPAYCTREYQPVCARRYDQRRTFANACLAERAGYRIIGFGECGHGDYGRPQVCTQEYAPVCATRRGALRTFPNACVARAEDWRIIGRGRC